MGEPLDTVEEFEDPVLDDPEPEITPPSESVSLPDEEDVTEPVVSQESQPPEQAAAPIPPVGPPPSPAAEAVPEAVSAPPYQYQPPPEPKIQFYTRDQLQEAVDNGVISANQMAEQLQLQLKEEAKREAIQAFHDQQRTQALVSQVQAYSQYVPGWNQAGTPAHAKAIAEYQRLLQRGLAANPVTELLALERAFGTIDHIKAQRASADLTRQTRDTVPAVTRRGTPQASTSKVDPLKRMDRDELKLYDKYIKAGHYRDWNEVREEIRWAANQTVNKDLKSNTERLMRR